MPRSPKLIRRGEVLGPNFVLNLWFLKNDMIEEYAEALYLAVFEDTSTIIKVGDNDDEDGSEDRAKDSADD